MQNRPSSPPKPVTDWWRPDLSNLPRLTLARRGFRLFARGVSKLLVLFNMYATVTGLENFPKRGPALVVINHLGDADAVLLAASIPYSLDGMGKVENDEHWLIGPTFRAYGVIGVHRGRPDRKALRSALDGLAEGRMIALAPEGRQTVTGGLEEGTEGAAFLAMKSGAPIVPIAMTGTENENIYNHKWWRRARVTLSVGKPFQLQQQADRQKMLREGTNQIMEALASLLPESYQGNYKVNQV
ncbi:MAG TPA: lysophospholipid acyltransferase family protein [Anaerolineales bacterium]|nr:lysophospholipid acyltransferase family protein [Anaerolineales bacterium]